MANLGEISIQINANVAGLTKGLNQANRMTVTTMKNIKGETIKTTESFKNMGGQMVSTGKTMAVTTKQSFGNMLRTMLNFQGFMAKIIHYITFSIGVQMVMGIRRGIESIIDIFKRFQESVVNAAAVSGYLGKAFDKARDSISDLSRELARRTIFTATETAEAMYTVACLPPDEIVLDGDYCPIRVAEIKSGDYVIGRNGLPTLVKSNFERYCSEQELINVNPYYVESFRVTPNHPLLIIRPSKCKYYPTRPCKPTCQWKLHGNRKCDLSYNYKLEWMDAGDVNDSDFLVVPIIKEEKEIKLDWYKFGDYNNIKNRIHYPEYLDEEFSYFLGRFMADGWIHEGNDSITIIYNIWELNEHERMKRYIKSLGLKTWDRFENGSTTVKMIFSSRILMKFLKEYIGKYSYNKKIPSFMFNSKLENVSAFLRGYIDGDGHINKRDYVGYSTVSYKIHRAINLLFARFDVIASQGSHYEEKISKLPSGWEGQCRPSYGGRVNNNSIIEKLGWEKRYNNKYNYNQYYRFDDYIAIPIQSIGGESYDGYVYNIETEDNTFMTSVVTHNSAGIDPVTTSAEELIPILQYAAATKTDLAEATKYVITTLKQFKMGLEDTNLVVDTFTTMITNSFMTAEKMADGFRYVGQIAGELNQDFREVTAALTLLTDRGYTGGQAGQRLNMIFTKLLKPTEQAQRMLAELGLSLGDIDPTTHNLVEILHKLREAQFGVAQSSTMFRARTAAAAATLVSAVDEIEEYVLLSKEMAGITDSIAKKQMQTLSASFKQLQGDAEELAISIGDRLAESLDILNRGFIAAIDLAEKAWEAGTLLGMPIDLGPLTGYSNLIVKLASPLGLINMQLDLLGIALGNLEDEETWIAGIEAFTEVGDDGLTMLQRFSKEGVENLARTFGILNLGVKDSQGALQDYSDAVDEVMRIKGELASYTTDELKNTQKYTDLQTQLISANIKLRDSENALIDTSGAILDNLIQMDTQQADAIAAYENQYKAESKVTQLESRREGLLERQAKLEGDLSKIQSIRGSDSKEYANALNEYDSISRQLISTNTDLATATTKVNEAETLFNTLLDSASGQVKENIEIAKELIDLRGQLLRAQSDYNNALREYNRQADIQENREKYLAEAMLTVYELQDKLFEIELDRYKLAQDKKDLNDELFEQLAEEGLLTEEVIQEYKDWKIAEGDLAKAKVAYAKGEISEEQLAYYLDKANQEMREYSVLVMGVEGESEGLVKHYMDLGIASNRLADTWTQLMTKSNDLEQSAERYKSTSMDLDDAWLAIDGIVKITANSVKTAWQNAQTFSSVLDGIIERLGNISRDIQINLEIDVTDVYGRRATGITKEMARKYGIPYFPYGKGIVAGQKGFLTKGPQMGLIGEKGPEAVIPLAGANRKYGMDILKYIIPKYYPELSRFKGAVLGGGSTTNYTGDSVSESFTVTGPITVVASNPADFSEQLKLRYRTTSRR